MISPEEAHRHIKIVSLEQIERGYSFNLDFLVGTAFAVDVLVPWLYEAGYRGLFGIEHVLSPMRSVSGDNLLPAIILPHPIGTAIKFNETCENSEELEVLMRLLLSVRHR